MRRNILLAWIILLLSIVVAYLLFRPKGDNLLSQPLAEESKNHFAYFMQSDFYTGILESEIEIVEPTDKKIYGGIVSHHFYMEREIAKFFGKFGGQSPRTIVILGPNHFNAGNGDSDILVSKYSYQTPWGALEPDVNAINALLVAGSAKNQEEPFEREHSISVLVGFVKHRFPNAQLVPVILKRNTSEQRVAKLAQELNRILPEDSLVIASVDFSHHVTNEIAQSQDKVSLQQLKDFDYTGIAKRTPEEIDSPPSIGVLLKFLELKGAKIMSYTNTNQALVSGNLDNPDVTSYFFAHFTAN